MPGSHTLGKRTRFRTTRTHGEQIPAITTGENPNGGGGRARIVRTSGVIITCRTLPNRLGGRATCLLPTVQPRCELGYVGC